jgi:predicted ATPase
MGNLFLNSLEVHNFRGFKHLQIERLRRVNLIVGKNNIGKSSLLEALELYAHNGDPALIWKFLQARDESKPYNLLRRESSKPENILLDLKYLFFGRKEIDRSTKPIIISPINSPDDLLSISIGRYTRLRDDEEGILKLQLLQPDEYDVAENSTPRFTIQTGKLSKSYSLTSRLEPRPDEFEIKANCIATAPNGLDREVTGVLWDRIALTDLEKDVVEAMRIIAPGIERLSVVGSLESRDRALKAFTYREQREVIPIIKVSGIEEPIALRSLGDGMQRIFGIALALVNAKDGILLIDEVENGLHYSVQPDIWHLICQLAHRLNVQVFATTHSWDCVEGFQMAAQKEGLLIRLQSKKDEISTVLYDEEDLAIATREQIEVR